MPISAFILQRHARQSHASGGAKRLVAASADQPARVFGFDTLGPAAFRLGRRLSGDPRVGLDLRESGRARFPK
jgi:hypothetical protein